MLCWTLTGASDSQGPTSVHEFGFLAGLPRTGSTLLTCLIGQNPDVHVSGGSPLARLMFGAHDVCETYAREGLVRVRRTDFTDVLVSEIPRLYYQDIEQRYILEKDRAWAHDPLGFLNKITDNPRVIVLLRSIPEIMQSFVHVKVNNGDVLPERDLLVQGVDPLLDALRNTVKALEGGDDRFLFGTYDQLIRDPEGFTRAVYGHFGWDWFEHDFNHVDDLHLEDDASEHSEGLHDVRQTIERRALTTRVSAGLMRQAEEYDEVLWKQVQVSLRNTPHRHF